MKALVTDNGLLIRSANLLTKRSMGNGLKEVELPRPVINKNEILVKVSATALNPIDTKFVDVLAPAGNVAGCDFGGTIEEVGEDARGSWNIGDRVAGFVQGSIDEERGAFAEYIKVERDLVWKLPDEVKDEEGASFGLAVATAMQALHLHLDVPWPDESAKSPGSPIFIYAGSSSVGLFAIQLAKKAGCTVVTTASPHSFELVKKYGADHVFDYHAPTAAQDVAKAHPDITRAVDCFSEGESTEFCAQVMQDNGGKVVTLLDSKTRVPGVETTFIMSFQLLGKAFAWLPPIGPKFPAATRERDALIKFYASLPELAKTLKTPPVRLVEGGFRGIQEGLDMIRAKKVSGAKLVVKL